MDLALRMVGTIVWRASAACMGHGTWRLSARRDALVRRLGGYRASLYGETAAVLGKRLLYACPALIHGTRTCARTAPRSCETHSRPSLRCVGPSVLLHMRKPVHKPARLEKDIGTNCLLHGTHPLDFTRYTARARMYCVSMLQELGANDLIRSRYNEVLG